MESYLRRIGFENPTAAGELLPDEATLRALHRAHMATVPFENLDIHIGRPIVLDTERIVAKIVEERRGGFCYELNGGFAELLRTLGFKVSLLEARVHTDSGLGIRFDHLCLRVDLDRPFLVDVGFGDLFMEPIVLEPSVSQTESGHRFRIEPVDEPFKEPLQESGQPAGDWFDLFKNDRLEYRFTAHPGSLADFEPGCHYHQTSPESSFTNKTVCTRPTAMGRVTLSGRTLTETRIETLTETVIKTNTPTGRETRSERETKIAPDQIGHELETRFDIALTDDQLDQLAAANQAHTEQSR